MTAAARQFGTPVYVLVTAAVSAAAAEVESAFPAPWLLHYSVKANDLPAVAGFLHERGWAASVVSTGEWLHARTGGLINQSLAFEGIGKTDAELRFAVREVAAGRPLRWLSVESGQELLRLRQLASDARLGHGDRAPVDVLVRLNPAVEPKTRAEFAVGTRASKFGMSRAEILSLARDGYLSGSGIRLRGVHVHAGSDLREVTAWAQAGLHAAELLSDLASSNPGTAPDTVDFGGGFPLRAAGAPAPAQFCQALRHTLDKGGLSFPDRTAVEPGRFLVGAAGWLVASVLHARTSRQGQQVVLDAGMTELMRPALYGSRHPVHPLAIGSGPAGPPMTTALEGPVCELTDSFGSYRLPPLDRGDLVAIQHAGAYAASLTSRYNGRPQPAEILLWPDGTLQRCDRPRSPEWQ